MSVERIHHVSLLVVGHGIPELREKFLPPVCSVGEDIFSLETFYTENAVAKVLDKYPTAKIFLDSGAFSLMCKAVKERVVGPSGKVTLDPEIIKQVPGYVLRDISQTELEEGLDFQGFLRRPISRHLVDSSFFDTKEIKQYLESYIKFVHKYKKQLQVYVNLDTIFDPEKTWNTQKYLESCGLKPLPVFHYGEDFKWLKRYMDNYDYLGIGGVSQVPKQKFIENLGDPAFKLISKSKQGIKVHGFAVTSVDLLLRYDWFSCDSSTWVKNGAYGDVFMPHYSPTKKCFNYLTSPVSVRVSNRPSKSGAAHFASSLNKFMVEEVRKYFRENDIDEEKLKISHGERHKANLIYFQNLSKYLSSCKTELPKTQGRFF